MNTFYQEAGMLNNKTKNICLTVMSHAAGIALKYRDLGPPETPEIGILTVKFYDACKHAFELIECNKINNSQLKKHLLET